MGDRARAATERSRRLADACEHLAYVPVVVLLCQPDESADAGNHACLAYVAVQPPDRGAASSALPVVERERRFHEVEQIAVVAVTAGDVEPAADHGGGAGGGQ